jgi:hypothetical protein
MPMGFDSLFSAKGQRRFIATHLWLTQLICVAIVLPTCILAIVVVVVALVGEGGATSHPLAGTGIAALFTVCLLALAVVLLPLAWWLPPFLTRRNARKLAERGYDDEELRIAGGLADHRTAFVRVGFLGVLGQFALLACLLAALAGASAWYYLNALWAVPPMVLALTRWPTRSRREEAVQQFGRLVRECKEVLHAQPHDAE